MSHRPELTPELDRLLQSVFDGETPANHAEVRRAQASSPAFAEALAQTHEIVAALGEPVRAPDLSRRILAGVHAARPFVSDRGRRRVVSARLVGVASALGVFLVASMGVLWWQRAAIFGPERGGLASVVDASRQDLSAGARNASRALSSLTHDLFVPGPSVAGGEAGEWVGEWLETGPEGGPGRRALALSNASKYDRMGTSVDARHESNALQGTLAIDAGGESVKGAGVKPSRTEMARGERPLIAWPFARDWIGELIRARMAQGGGAAGEPLVGSGVNAAAVKNRELQDQPQDDSDGRGKPQSDAKPGQP